MTHCDKAPEGWTCTRQADHDGPCAGWPTKTIPPTFRTEPHAPPPDDDEFSDYDEGYKTGWQEAREHIPSRVSWFMAGIWCGVLIEGAFVVWSKL